VSGHCEDYSDLMTIKKFVVAYPNNQWTVHERRSWSCHGHDGGVVKVVTDDSTVKKELIHNK
jgi:hypothetical protein